MKKFILMFIPALICGIMFISCESDKLNPKEDEIKSEPMVFQYVKTELGGCNIRNTSKSDNLKKTDDAVTITISEGFVNVFVGHNYTCKGQPFETEVKIIDDVIFMYIIDSGGSYYRCKCYYTFDFTFQWQGILNQEYKILLIRPFSEDPVVISEGIIEE